MKTRIITAIIGLPLLIFIVYYGKWLLSLALAIVTLIALKEYIDVFKKGKEFKISFLFMTILSLFILYFMKTDFYAIPFILVICFIACMGYEVYNPEPKFLRAAVSVFFLIYVPIMFGFIMMFENVLGGKLTIWMCFIAPFATDTFAYFGGRAFGKRKLTPISPNKTIAGSVIGFICCALLITGYGYILRSYYNIELPLYYYTILGAIASIAGQIGDISASLIKRTYGVKDYGHILPGHGGILDRFDSVIFTIPIIYIFTYYYLG